MERKTDIFTKEIELSDDLNKYIQKKVERLYRFLDKINETRIDLTHFKTNRESDNRFVAQITLRGRGFILRAEERAEDIRTALDKVMDKIERQIERYKGKKHRSRTSVTPVTDLLDQTEEAEEKPLIVRRKTFRVMPMDEIEAIEQMNLLGHEDFFIFYNADSRNLNVLYKRRDGSYGIIEPEIG